MKMTQEISNKKIHEGEFKEDGIELEYKAFQNGQQLPYAY